MTKRIRVAAIAATSALALGGAALASRRTFATTTGAAAREEFVHMLRRPNLDVDSLSVIVTEGDIFRLARAPSLIAFGETERVQPPPPPKPARPAPPIVTALFGGPIWRAVLENVVGFERPLIVAKDMKAGPFRVDAITRQSVRLSAGDTSWTLQLRKP